ncbi:MAG: tRNA (adenosine(37)-N6)-dimethylallyltransferase MiaA [Gemmatimonadetes bacterium]|nr:tRNA (adenosine(37)-N6)-dimethylallyltransferase MiaA [Gemmatimonadota bacterium]
MNSTGNSTDSRRRVLALAGPTASGKTRVGIALARALGGEVVSGDARQVYRYLDIGTAKPTTEERALARHHMLNVVDPDETYSAGHYAIDASAAIKSILDRNRVPILVGGSGLYLKATLDGFSPLPRTPRAVRGRLLDAAQEDPAGVYQRLREVDPVTAGRLHANDTKRIVRALEVFELTGTPLSVLHQQPMKRTEDWRVEWFGLEMDRQVLYRRIEERVDRMIAAGLVDEVRELERRGYSRELNALNTFGYREVFDHLDGELDLAETAAQIKMGTRRYAKRQLTWFRKETRLTWIDAGRVDAPAAILKFLDTH